MVSFEIIIIKVIIIIIIIISGEIYYNRKLVT